MGSEFRPAIEYVLTNECDDVARCGKRIADVGGGFGDDPRDRGGATVYGISAAIRWREDVTPAELGIADLTNASLRSVKREDAEAVWRSRYWERYPYRELATQDVATKVFDAAANLNWPKPPFGQLPRVPGHRLAQQAANALGTSIAADGILGPNSVDAINSLDAQVFLKAFVGQLVAYYDAIIAKAHADAVAQNNPALEQECWRPIWMARAYKLPT